MKVWAIIGALIGAILGAVAWAGISAATGYEIGYVAWAIGGLVGFGAKVLDGKGRALAAICAALALGSIFVGKMGSAYFVVQKDVKESFETAFNEQLYREIRDVDAVAFAAIESEDQYPQFMVDYGYAEVASVEEITQEDVAYFRQDSVPELQRFQSSPPSYEAWRQEKIAGRHAMLADLPLATLVVENLGLLDIVFGLLGVVTAFGMVAREE